jgi:hypothetical protein
VSDFVVQLDPVEFPDGQAELRLCVGPGKFTTFMIKNGDTITTADPATAKALAGMGTTQVAVLTQKPSKPTHDVDSKPLDTQAPVVSAKSQ